MILLLDFLIPGVPRRHGDQRQGLPWYAAVIPERRDILRLQRARQAHFPAGECRRGRAREFYFTCPKVSAFPGTGPMLPWQTGHFTQPGTVLNGPGIETGRSSVYQLHFIRDVLKVPETQAPSSATSAAGFLRVAIDRNPAAGIGVLIPGQTHHRGPHREATHPWDAARHRWHVSIARAR